MIVALPHVQASYSFKILSLSVPIRCCAAEDQIRKRISHVHFHKANLSNLLNSTHLPLANSRMQWLPHSLGILPSQIEWIGCFIIRASAVPENGRRRGPNGLISQRAFNRCSCVSLLSPFRHLRKFFIWWYSAWFCGNRRVWQGYTTPVQKPARNIPDAYLRIFIGQLSWGARVAMPKALHEDTPNKDIRTVISNIFC